MHELVLLPATEPGDETYGSMPERIDAYPDASIHQIRFPTMVWYNKTIRRETTSKIRSLGVEPIILIGFSKSGLGVWNVAREIPNLVSGMIIFDSPSVRLEPPLPEINPYYESPTAWREDVPNLTVEHFQTVMPKTSKLVLISGESFHDEMCTFADTLAGTSINYIFLQRQHLKHHWRSGWIEEGLKALIGPGSVGN